MRRPRAQADVVACDSVQRQRLVHHRLREEGLDGGGKDRFGKREGQRREERVEDVERLERRNNLVDLNVVVIVDLVGRRDGFEKVSRRRGGQRRTASFSRSSDSRYVANLSAMSGR